MSKNDPPKGEPEVVPPFPKMLQLSEVEHMALKAVLHRDWTCRQSHGGLRELLSLNHTLTAALLAFLERI